MWTLLLTGSRSQPSCAPFWQYSSIFCCRAGRESEGERNSSTKSGQMGRNFSHSSSENASSRSLRTQETSGERVARLGRINPVEDPKTWPVPSRSAQISDDAVNLLL